MWEKMNLEINIIKINKMNDGLFIQIILKQQKLPLIGFYGCIIQLTKFQIIMKKKFNWQKKHLENKTGTKESYKPIKIKKK